MKVDTAETTNPVLTYSTLLVNTIQNKYQNDQLNVTSKRMEDILVYNKVPKCGSSTLGQLLIELSKINNFTLGGEYHGPQSFNRKIQENVIERIEALPRPVYFQGHYSFINHTKFGRMEPVYINLLRDPVDRLVSYYFFDRMKAHGNTEALEKAKYVIESSYSVVGILEEFEKTLAVRSVEFEVNDKK
ncbi:Heparan sulfate 2-O-sulfotransferase pipe [Nymphon striatum]|nr:Heparan sulfate 2-O-sulfotransferase pipe [Nymphon striatum]